MVFNSTAFLFFFPIVVFLYFALPGRYRWVLLLLSSYFFYMYWKVEYVLLIVLSTLVDYFAGLRMSMLSDKTKRRPYLALSILSNLGILFTFKYFNFFSETVNSMLELMNMAYAIPAFHMLLPIGISFYTFQTMSYSIDVYKGKINAEKNIGHFALYVTYFPQLVAGPIERASSLIPQLKKSYSFDYYRVTSGLKLMAWGLFKKVVVADSVAPMVDYMWSDPENFGGFSIMLAVYMFAFQVYCDFSGYSDIAIGASRIMGITLMTNFRRPYYAKSVAELWSRWHISLITWFRDYLFMPLIRSQKFRWPWQYNIVIIYILSGIWHGADWSFIMWGFLSGLIIVAGRMMPKTRSFIYKLSGLSHFPRLDAFMQVIITFNLCAVLIVYFRSKDISQAHMIYSQLFDSWGADIKEAFTNANGNRSHILYLGYDSITFMVTMLMVFVFNAVEFVWETKGSIEDMINKSSAWIRWSLYISVSVLIVLFSFDRDIPFIYFQF